MATCKNKNSVFKTSEASTKAWFRGKGLLDQSNNVLNYAEFLKANSYWSKYADDNYGIKGRLFAVENGGQRALPNRHMFHRIDAFKGIYYPDNAYLQAEYLSKSAEPEITEFVFDKEEVSKERASIVFDQLATKFEKAFGIKSNVISEEDATLILENSQTPYEGQPAFFYGDQVYFIKDRADMSTMVHEFSHPLIKAIAIKNPKLFSNLYNKLVASDTGKTVLAEVMAGTKLEYGTQRFQEEVLVRAMELDAKQKLEKIVQNDGSFKEFINMIMLAIKKILAEMTRLVRVEKLKTTTTLEQLTDMMLFEDFQMDSIKFDNTDFADFKSEYDTLLTGLELTSAKKLQEAINRAYTESRFQLLQLYNAPWKLKDELAGKDGTTLLRNIRDHLNKYQTVNLDPNSITPEEIIKAMESQQEQFRVRGIALINSLSEVKVFAEKIESILNEMFNTNRHLTGQGIAKVSYFSEYVTRQKQFLNDLTEILGTGRNNEFVKEVKAVREVLSDAEAAIKKLKKEAVTELFVDNSEFMQEEMDKKIKDRVTQILKADNIEDSKINKLVETIISNPEGKSFNLDLTEYPINKSRANILVADVKEYYFKRLNRTAIEKYLSGETEDLGFFQAWLNPYLSMDDPLGSFARYMKIKLGEAETKSLSQANTIATELLPYLQDVNYNANNTNQLGKMLLSVDKVGYTNGAGEFEEWEVYSFKNKFINWRRDKAELQHNFEKARETGDKDKIRTALQALWEFEEKYMHRKYKQDYYNLQMIWKQDNTVKNPITGQDVTVSADLSADAFLERQAAMDKMNLYKNESFTELDDLYEFTESDVAKAEYEQLYQTTNADGTNKTGDDLLKALVRRKYRAESKKFYEYNLNEERVQRDYSNFVQELAALGITEDAKPDEFKTEMDKYTRKNFRTAYTDSYYRSKELLFKQLSEITARYKSPVADEMSELYIERWRMSNAITDKNGTTNALQYTNGALQKIKEIEDRIVELQKEFDAKSGLSKENTNKLNIYDARYANGDTLSADEELEYAKLKSAKNQLGMPAAVYTKYKQILGEIAGLTEKVPTEYYFSAFYEALGDTEVSEQLTMENADTWINSEDVYNAMTENDKFREWFQRNHYQKLVFDGKAMVLKYFRTKAWTSIEPSSADHYQSTELKNPLTGKFVTIPGVPSGKYYSQKIKKEWRTGYNPATQSIELKVGEEVDNKGNFLPRANATDKKYMNPEYAEMEKNPNSAEFKLLKKMTEEYLKVQEGKPGSSKLYLDLARFRQRSNMELVQSGKAKENLGSTLSSVKDFMKSFTVKSADDQETQPGFNADVEAILIETDLQGQPITRIPVRGLYKLKLSEVSQDILPSFYTYLHSLNEQEALIKEEPIAKAIKDVMNDPDNAIKRVNTASKNIFKNTGKLALLSANTNRRSQALDYFIDRTFYGQKYSGFEQENPMANKVANFLMHNASRSFIAMDMVSALKNRFGLIIQNSIEAAAGTYYNAMSFAKGRMWSAQAMIELQSGIYSRGPKSLMLQLMEYFDPITGKTKTEFGKSSSRTFLKDFFDGSFLYDARKFMEVEGSLQVFGGMMYHLRVEQTQPDGNKKEIPYIEAFELDANRKLKLKEGIDPEWGPERIEHILKAGDTFEKLSKQYNIPVEELKAKNKINDLSKLNEGDTIIISKATKFNDYKLKIQGVGKRLNGMSDPWDSPQAEKFLGYRLFTFYKKYATQMFLNRFQADMSKDNKWGHVYNWDLGTTTRGYYVTAVIGAMKFLKNGMAYMPIMTTEEKAAFRKVVTEGMFLFVMAMVTTMLYGYDQGDEDRFEKMRKREEEMGYLGWTANHMLYQLIAVRRENQAFFSPKEWVSYGDTTSIVFGPTVNLYLKLLQDVYYIATGDEKAVYKSDVGPYSWQQKDEDGTYDYKLWNHLLSIYGIKGKNYDPVQAIKNDEAFQNLR